MAGSKLGGIVFLVILSSIMFGFFKKKEFKDISQYPDTWTIGQAVREGKPIFIRTRSGLNDAVGHPNYPFQIGVAVPLLTPTKDGLTTNEEAEVLGKIEDNLNQTLSQKSEAVEAMVITTNGMREFMFYASEWKPEYFEKEVKSVEPMGHELQFMMQHDPKWKTFQQFSPK